MNKDLDKFYNFLSYGFVICMFAKTWFGVMVNYTSVSSVLILAVIVVTPFVLLFRILQYKCKVCYLLVLAFFTYYLVLSLGDMFNNLDYLNNGYHYDDTFSDDILGLVCVFAGGPEYEFVGNLKWIPFNVLVIILLIGRRISTPLNFTKKEKDTAVVVGLLAGFLMLLPPSLIKF